MSDKRNYLRLAVTSERLHRLFLETVSRELSRLQIRDINSVQSLILYHVGQERDKLTIGDLTHRGYYLGANVFYNLSKMVRNGYFIQFENSNDKRSSYVKLSEKGIQLYEKLDELFKEHSFRLGNLFGIFNSDLMKLNNQLNEIESFLKEIKNG